MRIRSFAWRKRSRRASPWPDRAALALVALMLLIFVVIAIDNVRKRDALTRWRTSLELAAGHLPWPAWSSAWPALPEPPTGRHRLAQDWRGVYAFAATHAPLIDQMPCFCGCGKAGHRSLLNCFVTGFRADGTPTWNDHALTCELCVHIAREVYLMDAAGLPPAQTRAAIDRQYAKGRTSTPTPLNTHRTGGRP